MKVQVCQKRPYFICRLLDELIFFTVFGMSSLCTKHDVTDFPTGLIENILKLLMMPLKETNKNISYLYEL